MKITQARPFRRIARDSVKDPIKVEGWMRAKRAIRVTVP